MIGLRWLESQTHAVNGEPFVHPVTVRTLQYRQVEQVWIPGGAHPTVRHAVVNGHTEERWSEWKDVPVVNPPPATP